MRNKGQLIFGSILILLGVVFVIGTITDINVWAYCWPVGLIAVGLWMIFRPKLMKDHPNWILRPFADIHLTGDRLHENQEIWIFVGDVRVDLTDAALPVGETVIRLFGFVGDIDLLVPEDVGFSISSTAFITDAKVLGQNVNNIFMTYEEQSSNLSDFEKQIRLEMNMFVADLTVKQI